MKNNILSLVLTFCSLSSLYGQEDSLKHKAQIQFSLFIDSILQKEIDKKNYELFNFSELSVIREYPLEITSLAYPSLYSDRDEYYAAFLYREKYNDTTFPEDLNKQVLKQYTKLRKIILKTIRSGKQTTGKEKKRIYRLQSEMENSEPPLTGYFQKASIRYTYNGVKNEKHFSIIYDLQLNVLNYGE